MLRKTLLLPAFLLLSLAAFSQKSSSKKTTAPVDLADALAQKLVALSIEGLGGFQEHSLKLVFRNLNGKPLRLRIPQGQLLEPADSSLQTLVTAKPYTLAVAAKTPAELFLNTFCTQAGDRSPVAGAGFAVGALAPEALRSLLKFITDNGKEASVAQTAVWCLTSHASLSEIDDAELAKFTAELTGKPIPGYRVRREVRVINPGDRAMPGKAMVVEGNYQYTLEKDERVVMWLLDASGKKIKQVSKEEKMIAGEHRGSMHLEVWNLPPGKYVLRMQTVKGEVIKDTEVEF